MEKIDSAAGTGPINSGEDVSIEVEADPHNNRNRTTRVKLTVYECKEPGCGYWSSLNHEYHQHVMSQHTQRKYYCSVCDYKTNWPSDVKRHILKVLGSSDGVSHVGAEKLSIDDHEELWFKKYDRLKVERIIVYKVGEAIPISSGTAFGLSSSLASQTSASSKIITRKESRAKVSKSLPRESKTKSNTTVAAAPLRSTPQKVKSYEVNSFFFSTPKTRLRSSKAQPPVFKLDRPTLPKADKTAHTSKNKNTEKNAHSSNPIPSKKTDTIFDSSGMDKFVHSPKSDKGDEIMSSPKPKLKPVKRTRQRLPPVLVKAVLSPNIVPESEAECKLKNSRILPSPLEPARIKQAAKTYPASQKRRNVIRTQRHNSSELEGEFDGSPSPRSSLDEELESPLGLSESSEPRPSKRCSTSFEDDEPKMPRLSRCDSFSESHGDTNAEYVLNIRQGLLQPLTLSVTDSENSYFPPEPDLEMHTVVQDLPVAALTAEINSLGQEEIETEELEYEGVTGEALDELKVDVGTSFCSGAEMENDTETGNRRRSFTLYLSPSGDCGLTFSVSTRKRTKSGSSGKSGSRKRRSSAISSTSEAEGCDDTDEPRQSLSKLALANHDYCRKNVEETEQREVTLPSNDLSSSENVAENEMLLHPDPNPGLVSGNEESCEKKQSERVEQIVKQKSADTSEITLDFDSDIVLDVENPRLPPMELKQGSSQDDEFSNGSVALITKNENDLDEDSDNESGENESTVSGETTGAASSAPNTPASSPASRICLSDKCSDDDDDDDESDTDEESEKEFQGKWVKFMEACWATRMGDYNPPKMMQYDDIVPEREESKPKPECHKCSKCHFHSPDQAVVTRHSSGHRLATYKLKAKETKCKFHPCDYVCMKGKEMEEHNTWHFADPIRDGVDGALYHKGPIHIFHIEDGIMRTVYTDDKTEDKH